MRVAKSAAKASLDGMDPAAALAYKQPGKLSRLKSRLFSMLPYHRQGWSAGALSQRAPYGPLTLPQMAYPAAPEGQQVYARLLTPLSSASARQGSPVEAVVTRPVFSAGHTLLFPEGTRLTGEVVEAQPPACSPQRQTAFRISPGPAAGSPAQCTKAIWKEWTPISTPSRPRFRRRRAHHQFQDALHFPRHRGSRGRPLPAPGL